MSASEASSAYSAKPARADTTARWSPVQDHKYGMSRRCHSHNRCAQITCETCARRYSAHISRRIRARSAERVCAIQIDAQANNLNTFCTWRVEARNLVDHLRRQSRWWRHFGLHVWRSKDGSARGIAMLRSVTLEEVTSAFAARWPTKLRPITLAVLRNEITCVVHPNVIALHGRGGRYQPIKFVVWPRTLRTGPTYSKPTRESRLAEPMPIIF